MKRSPLQRKSKSEVSLTKERIQALVREIVINRDQGCFMRHVRYCGGEIDAEGVVLQADHIISRSNSATYEDKRLIVCLCKRCHGWKHWHKEQYDAMIREMLPKDRVELWDKMQKESYIPKRTMAYDWRLEEIARTKELEAML